MKRDVFKTSIAVAMLIFLIATACAAEESQTGWATQSASSVAVATGGDMVFMPVPTAGSDPAGNFTKLEIIPSYMHFSLKPGESDEMTVTVRNRDKTTATIQPAVKSQPYGGPYLMDNSWVAITPLNAEVPAGGSAKFTVRASVPSDAIRGSYNSMVAFTDESYPSPYPTPFPNYIHVMSLAIDVTSPPAIQISTPYISDQMESGKEYPYEVTLKNTGNNPIQLNAKIGSDNYPMYGPSGVQEPALTESAFTLNAPSTLQPGATGTLNIDVRVPPDATGYYSGYIDLGIDDPSIREGEGRIQLNFMVWKQPQEPFVKKFSMDAADPISIELTSGISLFSGSLPSGILSSMPIREPAFDTILTGPEGAVRIRPVQKVIKGSVNVGGDPMLITSQQAGTYQEMNAQYITTYAADGRPGAWQLSVMPKNAQSFEYKITLGGADAAVQALKNTQTHTNITNTVVVEQTSVPVQLAVNVTP